MVKVCYFCKQGEIVFDKKMSGQFCTSCGECFELGAFTDEVQYREDDRGRYTAVGSTYSVEKGFVNSKFSSHTQFMTSVDNAKNYLKRYCDKLYISDAFANMSAQIYHTLLINKFMNGRRLNVVLAACLYISVRTEGANVILLDISDVSEANVYDIGRYYFQIIRILKLNIQTVDPCEYTIRFVDMLNLGDRSLPQVKRTAICIRDTANRMVQRMKRDWIHFGRRPSGVCAAAVLVGARINNVRCTIKDIISIAKVCESTIRKRINEFIETPSSQLTYKEFMSQDLEQEEDPPSYKTTLKDTVEANLDKVEKYQEIIEEHLKDSRARLRGIYAKFLKEIFTTQDEKIKMGDDESCMIQETIIDQNILAVNEKIVHKMNSEQFGNDSGNPSTEEIEYWAEFRPSAKSLGLLKREQPELESKTDYDDLLDKPLDDMNEDEIDTYIISDQTEISQRELEWSILNKEYLEKEERENLKRLNEENDPSTNKSSNKSRKKRKKTDDNIEAASTSEAVEAAFKAKLIKPGVNLKELFNEDTSSTLSGQQQAETSHACTSDSGVDESHSDDAQLIQIYHSYALKSVPEQDHEESPQIVPSELQSETSQSKSVIDQKTIVPEVDSDKQYDLPTKIDDDELYDEDDDYFDEEDELSKIKHKYNIDGDEGEEDIEDCGF